MRIRGSDRKKWGKREKRERGDGKKGEKMLEGTPISGPPTSSPLRLAWLATPLFRRPHLTCVGLLYGLLACLLLRSYVDGRT